MCMYASAYRNKELVPSQSSFAQDSSANWYLSRGYGRVHTILLPELSQIIHSNTFVSQLPSFTSFSLQLI